MRQACLQSGATALTSASLGAAFISFEGGEGVGKSTHIRLLAACLQSFGIDVAIFRDPGGTRIGEVVRDILLDPANTDIDPAAELLLYEAARAQLVAEDIAPALQAGRCVLCDRFVDSSLAYQGAGRGLGFELVRQANQVGSKGIMPDRTLVLIDDAQTSLARAVEAGADRMESEALEFHERVRDAFLQLARQEPGRVRLIPIAEDKRVTARLVIEATGDLFSGFDLGSFRLTDELLSSVRREYNQQ
ncbi:MAG: dTMP kinase [Actinomycetia bacterium]|nr:dTMP kinase [Actinomycetes bacterium]